MLRRGRSVRPTNSAGMMPPVMQSPGSVMTPHDINAMIAMGTGSDIPQQVQSFQKSQNPIVTSSSAAPVPVRAVPNMTLAQISSTVQQWQQILSEVTQAVFVVVGEVLVPEVPVYMDLPTSKADLSSPVRTVTGTVTILYPQFTREEYIFMRVRVVDPNTAEVQQYYIPIAPANEKSTLNGVYYPQYVGRFRNPGEPAPEDLHSA